MRSTRATAIRATLGATLTTMIVLTWPGVGCAQTPGASPATAAADDETPDRLIRAMYESNSAADWPRFRALFLPGARIVSVGRDAPGRGRWFAPTVEEFIADRVRSGGRVRERELGRRELRYGAMVHAWSSYELHSQRPGTDSAGPALRGINSFQLIRAQGRWRIAQIAYTDDQRAGPVPAEFLRPPLPSGP